MSSSPAKAAAATPLIKHIVCYGLGNFSHPLTRHSVGQMTVNSLAKRLRLSSFSKDSKLSGELSEGRTDVPEYMKAAAGVQDVKVTLVKSSQYMNLSGKTLKPLLARYPLDPETAHFILYDHLEFPASKVGVRKGGSAGGQNGMRSCLEVLGKKNQGEVWQVRIGIDRPPGGMDVAAYVLSRAPLDFINDYTQQGAGTAKVWDEVLKAAYPPPKAVLRVMSKEEVAASMQAAKEKRERVRAEREKRRAEKERQLQPAGASLPPAESGTGMT